MTNTRLASHWRTDKVLSCLEKKQEAMLVRFIRDRHQERFFRAIRCLQHAPETEQGYGFSMMALCCLLIETIESYREGLPSTYQPNINALKGQRLQPKWQEFRVPPDLAVSGRDIFVRFFQFGHNQKLFRYVSDGAEFFRSIRNGLLHQGQTMNRWTLSLSSSRNRNINRNIFARHLESCFNSYLDELSLSKDWSERGVWRKAGRKIFWLAWLSQNRMPKNKKKRGSAARG